MTDAAFDLLGELPQGTTVLEASAGTGKTFTIAGLVARYVAEGVARMDELLVVTFGREATRELRDRVRERLVSARDGLLDPAAARAGSDDLLCHLATASDDDVAVRRQRLVVALASFDAATVVTTHSFCEQMLVGLGTAADVDVSAQFVDNLNDLVTEVIGDLYLRKWGLSNSEPPMLTVGDAGELARAVIQDGQATLVPNVDDESLAAVRWSMSIATRAEVERRKRLRRVLGYDDLLTRLQQTLAGPDTGPAATARLRQRYRVVLVDEFQDTDPVQWDILRLAFHGAATLVLVGDPKQAIYAFRGADVYAYLDAVELADHRATLAMNWRSDADLLRGLSGLFRGAILGDPRIAVAPVSAAHADRSLVGAGAPVQLRLVRRDGNSQLAVGPARETVTADVVREVVALLSGDARLRPRDGSPERPVEPVDIAVIVRTNDQLEMVHEALLAAGVPSVRRTTFSVFRTPAAADWIVLLEALEQPHRAARVRRLAISPFVGWDAAALEQNDVDRLGLRVREWLRVYEQRGVAALFETVSRDEQLPARLLGQVEGERRLTDLRHVGEALHAAAMAGQLGLTAGLEWLRHRVDEASDDSSVERGRRLDSDAAAVQVVTVHASKGLEFPVVFVPFGWDRHVFEPKIPMFHDETTGHRVRNVGGSRSPGFRQDQDRARTEEFGEDLRLLYVAMTRAQSRVTAWWAPSDRNTPCAPLHRLLFADDPARAIPERASVPARDEAVLTRVSALAIDGCLSVTVVPDETVAAWQRPVRAVGALALASLRRSVDTSWRRTSYSALTAGVHEMVPMIGSEPEDGAKDDEPATPIPAEAGGELQDVVSLWDALPGGAAFGTLIHSVLERLDTAADDLDTELRSVTRAQVARLGPAGLDAATASDALLASLATPLGTVCGDRTLLDIAPTDRLAELDFELPLCGGDRPNGVARLADLADLFRELPSSDPLRGYADQLADPVLGDAVLKGYLAGSIDAVMRVDGRYVVADYKTNRLGSPDAPLTAWDYRMDAMADAMLEAHYPLQALLYEVALHRFLRWRVPDYRPDEHLGGVLYLFLRGMCGPDVQFVDGSIPGVFAWQPPATLITAASDVLAGAR